MDLCSPTAQAKLLKILTNLADINLPVPVLHVEYLSSLNLERTLGSRASAAFTPLHYWIRRYMGGLIYRMIDYIVE